MTLGQRILAARQEAGLSQRQLAGGEITRNMLSALEHDCANPSVATLRYLSQKLDRPISYFLGEDVPHIPDYPKIQAARQAYDGGEFRQCLETLEEVREPGEILGREAALLRALAAMALAEEMTGQGRLPYARELLNRAEQAGAACPYFDDAQRTRLAFLRVKAGEEVPLPDLDEGLLLQARRALVEGRKTDALRTLDAARDRESLQWNELRGRVSYAMGRYREAAACFHRVEETVDVREELEICYRELGDYKMAYFYAKK